MERLFDHSGWKGEPEGLYTEVVFPAAPVDRPWCFINMVSSADGKTILGDRGSSASGLGSPTDQALMKRLRPNAQGVIIGSSTLNVDRRLGYPRSLKRAVITGSGDLRLDSDFFTDADEPAIVFAPEQLPESKAAAIQSVARLERVGRRHVDLREMMRRLRQEYRLERLLCEGGGTFNSTLFHAGVVDELFLTFAPKIKGGAETPTAVDGEPLPREGIVQLQLISLYKEGEELFMRYRVNRD